MISGGHDTISTRLTTECPGNGRPVHKHYPDGSWGSTCVYDDPVLEEAFSGGNDTSIQLS